MVIMIATEDTAALKGLADFLSRNTPHQIHPAGTLEEIEAVGTEIESLDLLLCARHFSATDGQAVQEAMQSKFPSLRAGYFTNTDDVDTTLHLGPQDRCFGPSSTPYEVLNWIHELEKLPPVEPPSQVITLPESLLGHTIGDYKIVSKRNTFRRSESYQALQISMQRPVVLERLKPEFQHDNNAKRNFRALVRAQANVVHPYIATVFEAQETREGEIFYTREFIRGKRIPELAAAKIKLAQRELLAMLRAAGESMVYYANRAIPRYRLLPQHVYQGDDGIPRLANLATIPSDAESNDTEDLAVLAAAIEAVNRVRSGPEVELLNILQQMKGQTPTPIRTWSDLVKATQRSLQRLSDISSAQPPKLEHLTGRLRKPKSKLKPVVLSGGALAAIATTFALLYPNLTKPDPRKLDDLVQIPAGSVTIGSQTIAVKTFWISKYEVSIEEYSKFLTAVPGLDKLHDHADQPKTKTSHKPLNWDDYFPAAQAGTSFKGHQISLNCPVLWADWWDAYAYAKWRNQRLPNEQEWELAARSGQSFNFPWGNDPSPSKANTGDDFSPTTTGGGQSDGFASWCEVDAKPEDITSHGVIGMAGNVAEWTTSWSQHPDFPDQQSPVYRGGSFSQKSAPIAEQRWAAKSIDLAQPFIGFRTVSDQPPSP